MRKTNVNAHMKTYNYNYSQGLIFPAQTFILCHLNW